MYKKIIDHKVEENQEQNCVFIHFSVGGVYYSKIIGDANFNYFNFFYFYFEI